MATTRLSIAVRVAERWAAAADVCGFRLVSTDAKLPVVEAGAHIDLEVSPGLIRQYSLINHPGDAADYVIGVKLEPSSRGGSKAIHERLRVGDALQISPPRNTFPLDATAGRCLLIAGGIGVTPLLSMARALQSTQRPFALHYFARSAAHVAFGDILETFEGGCHLHLGLDGLATAERLKLLLAVRSDDVHLYACGPGPMLDLSLKIAADLGWSRSRLHVEHFASAKNTALDAEDAAFELVLARLGRSVCVPPNESIVDVLRKEGIDVPVSCEQGICGTCITIVLGGTPDHRDQYLNDDEKGSGKCMLLCVSRAKGARLVLDL